MKFYLLRHGEAKNKDEDPEQGLSENGQAAVMKAARPDIIALQEVDQGTERACGVSEPR